MISTVLTNVSTVFCRTETFYNNDLLSRNRFSINNGTPISGIILACVKNTLSKWTDNPY